MKSLQNRIFLLFITLLLLVQAIAFWALFAGKSNQETQEINSRLSTAKTIFTEQFNSRSDYLAAFAETAAKDFGIKQVFDDDTRSLLVALNNHRKRIDADLAMAISSTKTITAQLQVNHTYNIKGNNTKKVQQGAERNKQFRYPDWLENSPTSHLYMLDDALYQLSFSPLTVGEKVIGWLAFGFQIDQRLANHFLEITQLHTDFIFQNNQQWLLIASSNEQAQLSFTQDIVSGVTPKHYISIGHLVTEFGDQRLGLAMYGLRDNFVEVLQKQWWQFVILTFITLLLSLASAYWVAASITKPIKRLVEQAKVIAKGNYHQSVELDDSSELGQLATEFNLMQTAVLSREKAITHLANHDKLSDLPNRNVLKLTLNHLIEQNEHFSIFHLNLGQLTDVNESLGHDVGDWLIIETAKRLSSIEQFQLVCHLGGDEFILLNQGSENTDIDMLISAVSHALDKDCIYHGINLQLQTKIGVAMYPTHTLDGKLLLQMADIALHYARKNNLPLQIFHHDLSVNSIERLNLINDLKQAISDNQLELFYQPKLCLKTGIATHMEALVRWKHPKLGMIPPDSFINIAEQTGQIKALTRWVLTTGLTQLTTWKNEAIDINMAVNISAKNLTEKDFYDYVCQSLAAANVSPDKLTLEITESAVVADPESAIHLLSKFKQQGIKISIDDYGTGYSSLAQLKQLPVHELKIDMSFVQRLKDDEDDQIIVHSTIELAHNMGLSVVAEGIEDEYALKWLAKQGCELGQGYFISRPQPADKITAWLREEKNYPLI